MSDFTDCLEKAKAGDPISQLNLVHYYCGSDGVERDEEAMLKYCTLAASQGFAPAQWQLGLMYERGIPSIVSKDYALAAKWYRLAAEQGNAHALHALGGLYKKGYGVVQDYVQALVWCSLALVKDYNSMYFLVQDLRDLKGKLNSDEIKTAQQCCMRFLEQHPAHAQNFSQEMYTLIVIMD
jgi:TPR repeat protein